jgi:hypothetical protein
MHVLDIRLRFRCSHIYNYSQGLCLRRSGLILHGPLCAATLSTHMPSWHSTMNNWTSIVIQALSAANFSSLSLSPRPSLNIRKPYTTNVICVRAASTDFLDLYMYVCAYISTPVQNGSTILTYIRMCVQTLFYLKEYKGGTHQMGYSLTLCIVSACTHTYDACKGETANIGVNQKATRPQFRPASSSLDMHTCIHACIHG